MRDISIYLRDIVKAMWDTIEDVIPRIRSVFQQIVQNQ